MGVILIIIYYIYNNLILWVGVTHFLCSRCSNVANVFKVHFVGFSNRLSHAKAVPLHRISKRAEIANK